MRPSVLLALLVLSTLAICWGSAHGSADARGTAARFIPASIAVEGREILLGSTSDDGHPDVDAVWGYLSGIAFTPTEEFAKLGLTTDGAQLLLEKKGEPRAIVLDLAYGGEVRTWRLMLERSQSEQGELRWKLAPGEIERLFSYRLISRSEAARLRDPKRTR